MKMTAKETAAWNDYKAACTAAIHAERQMKKAKTIGEERFARAGWKVAVKCAERAAERFDAVMAGQE